MKRRVFTVLKVKKTRVLNKKHSDILVFHVLLADN